MTLKTFKADPEAELADAYQAIKDSPAFLDILKIADEQYATADTKAKGELDNPARAQAYLQQAVAYDTMRLYIRGKLS